MNTNPKSNSLHLLPWIEKYRPACFSDVVLDNNLKKKFNKFVNDKNIPNLIITGVSGIGKTSTIRCIANELYGRYVNNYVLELDATYERNTKMINDIVDRFCRTKLIYSNNIKDKYAQFKIVIFDEADNLDNKVQIQINSLIEKYNKNEAVKFIFTCNSSANIIESIQSKCVIVRFKRINNNQMIEQLKKIAKIENTNYKKNVIEQIVSISNGDLRHAINLLQLLSNRYDIITIENVNELCDIPQEKLIMNIFNSLNNNNLHEAISVIKKLKDMGYSGLDILSYMITTLKNDISKNIDETLRLKYIKIISECNYKISTGLDTSLQLYSCLVDMLD